MSESINNTVKTWLIISWRHNDLVDGAYGECITSVKGTYEEAAAEARAYIKDFSPVGVVGVIE